MRRLTTLLLGVTLAAAAPAAAGTFRPAPLAPELGLDALTRGAARAELGRDLFASAHATVAIAHTDVYDRFPYLESREFLVVSDPRWDRLIFGERGGALRAFDGRGTMVGPLAGPRGLAVDDQDRVFVADAGNDRIVVLQASTTHGTITLTPVATLDGLGEPWGVAWSDGGTPFVPDDDRLIVAETGRSQVTVFALGGGAPRRVATLGGLGGGRGRFAGPFAVAVGRADGAHTRDLFVADAHNRRLVHLRDEPAGLVWQGETALDAPLVTALETDRWGNLYAVAPHAGRVRKFAPDLTPVATLESLARPRGFHLPTATVHDHRDGRRARVGPPDALSLEEWSDATGLRRWRLGVEVADLAVAGGEAPAATFTLTDRARVTLEVLDAADGRTLARRDAGTHAAGRHALALPGDLAGGGPRLVRIHAASAYADGPTATAQAAFHAEGSAAPPARAALLGAVPHPARLPARIAFVVPADAGGRVTLRLFDTAGRRVRSFAGPFAPGPHEVLWDGTDARGRALGAGVYLLRLEAGDERLTGRLVLVP